MQKSYINTASDNWYRSIIEDTALFPFSFTYNNVNYNGFDKSFELISKDTECKGSKEAVTFVWKKDEVLQITLICTHNFSYGETEWIVWFENIGNKNSGVLFDVKSVINFEGETPLLKGVLGDHINYYKPYCHNLKEIVHFETPEPLPTHVVFPYFNLEYGNTGSMLAIGWAGNWSADFSSDGNTTTFVARSTPSICTYLKPGEKIRTALFVKADYTVRDEDYATNYWREWYIKENMPKADKEGNDLLPFSTIFLSADTGLPNSDGSISENYTTYKPSLEKMFSEGIRADFRWLDAGWYSAPDGSSAIAFDHKHDWYYTMGTWEPDKTKWPDKTLLESTDYARENGMKTLLWFSPEMVQDIPNLIKNHGYKQEWVADFGLYNAENHWLKWNLNLMGNEDCYNWTASRIKKVLLENKIEMYREDVNLEYGRHLKLQDRVEGPNRIGITELKQVAAHYRLLDEMIETTTSFGGCAFVDCCAGGGGRNDIESLRRGVPILRSDRDRTSTDLRLSITSSLSKWIPFNGSCVRAKKWETDVQGFTDKYIFRASLLPILNIDGQFVYQTDKSQFEFIRNGIAEWKKVSPYLLKEFYTHTKWQKEGETNVFVAFSYYDSENKDGVLLAFRQEKCTEDTLVINLPYVKENEICTITDEDTKESVSFTKHEIDSGKLKLFFSQPRTARILWVKVKNNE